MGRGGSKWSRASLCEFPGPSRWPMLFTCEKGRDGACTQCVFSPFALQALLTVGQESEYIQNGWTYPADGETMWHYIIKQGRAGVGAGNRS